MDGNGSVRYHVETNLQDRTIWALDLGALVAGAKFRGEFEDRLKGVIKEVTASDGRIILFIDEVHSFFVQGTLVLLFLSSEVTKSATVRRKMACSSAC